MKLTFYTVLTHKPGYPVKYAAPPEYRIQTFIKDLDDPAFPDPGNACGEFEACIGGDESCYLSPAQFKAKVEALRRHLHKDKENFMAWISATRPAIL